MKLKLHFLLYSATVTIIKRAFGEVVKVTKAKERERKTIDIFPITVKPAQRIVVGNEAIVKRLCSLPATFHDISRGENFVTDGWQMQGTQPNYPAVLFLTVHGEFTEVSSGTLLSFDRTLLVAPSAPGSRLVYILLLFIDN